MAQQTAKQNQKINPNIKKNVEGISDRIKKGKLKISDLIIPISAFVILLLLSVFLFFPMLQVSFESQKEIKDIKTKVDQLQKFENMVMTIDQDQLISDLVVAKEVIPKILRVSDFVYYLDSSAKQMNLSTKEIRAGDINVSSSEDVRVKESLGVSGPLSYTGSLDNILTFLDEIQNFSPYLVTIRDVDLKGSNTGNWTVSFVLTGYYTPENQARFDAYRPFTLYTRYQDIIDIFKVRAEKLD